MSLDDITIEQLVWFICRLIIACTIVGVALALVGWVSVVFASVVFGFGHH